MSKLTWIPAVPALARAIASSITERIPRSSMSRIVKAPMPEALTLARSSASTSRIPTRAAREPSTIGEKPARFTSEGAPRPRTAARGMPWMFPVGLVSAVFASAWASNQTSPSFCRRAWKWRASPAIVPIATEWSPPITTGVVPAARASPTASRRASQTSRISRRYLRRGSPGPWVSWIFG
jgi:hypothetical protein